MSLYRPRIFISSTISDFRDLRSSLKYYLEELGYKVLLSEFNDFEKALDENTINACIKAIEISDIYILFIGHKYGGFFSEKNRISITRFEYQNAYQLFKLEKLKLIIFVREEIWRLKNDRDSLSELLHNFYHEILSKEQIKNIQNHDGPYIENAKLVFEFIDEVARTDEMVRAAKGEVEFPKGNWIHLFSNFNDIIDVLNIELNLKKDIGKIAREINLKKELANNLKLNIEKLQNGGLLFSYIFLQNVKKGLPDDPETMPCILTSEDVINIIRFSLYSGIGNSFSTQFLDQALESGDYLRFNKEKLIFEPSEIHEALIELKKQINFTKHISNNCFQWFSEFYVKYKEPADHQDKVNVDYKLLIFIIGLSNALENICNLSTAIYKALNGKNEILLNMKLISMSPFLKHAEEVKKTEITITEIQEILETI